MPEPGALAPRSQTALEHYREQAQRARRQAASDRAMADITTLEESRIALRASAAEFDHQAAQWQTLADELATFADQQTPLHGEALL